MEKNLKLLNMLLVISLLVPEIVLAASFIPQANSDYQKITWTGENIYITNYTEYITYESHITISADIHNRSNFITFYFRPTAYLQTFNTTYFYDEILIQTPNPTSKIFDMTNSSEYNRTDDSGGAFYKVPLLNTHSYHFLDFNANYTQPGVFQRIRPGEYAYYYQTYSTAEDHHISFSFDHRYHILTYPFPDKVRQDAGYSAQSYIYHNVGSTPFFFVLEDTQEKEFLQRQERDRERWFNIAISLIFFTLGATIPVLFEYTRKRRPLYGYGEVKKGVRQDTITVKVLKQRRK